MYFPILLFRVKFLAKLPENLHPYYVISSEIPTYPGEDLPQVLSQSHPAAGHERDLPTELRESHAHAEYTGVHNNNLCITPVLSAFSRVCSFMP